MSSTLLLLLLLLYRKKNLWTLWPMSQIMLSDYINTLSVYFFKNKLQYQTTKHSCVYIFFPSPWLISAFWETPSSIFILHPLTASDPAVVCDHSQCLEGHIQCDSTVWWRCSSWCGCTVLISTSKHHVCALIQLVSTFVCLFWFPSTPFTDFWCPEGLNLNHILSTHMAFWKTPVDDTELLFHS